MKTIGAMKSMRLRLGLITGLGVPLVLTTGFFTAGTNAGIACNTWPWVGDNWFISKKHFLPDIPVWKNFVENKLVT
jgi:heme A synthase